MFERNFKKCADVKVEVTINQVSIGVHTIKEVFLTRKAYELLERDSNYVFRHNKDGLKFEGVPGCVYDTDVKGYRNKRALRVSLEVLMETESIIDAINKHHPK